MLKKLSASALALVSLASISVAAINFDNPKANNLSDEIKNSELSVPAPAASAYEKGVRAKEWTIMVYLNGKNNLEPYAFLNLNQMEMIGSSDKVNIVVEFGRLATYSQDDGAWKSTRRYLIKKDNDTAKFTSPVVEDIGVTDMGDYNNVIKFGNWAKAKYPANHYMMIVWNHGSGWDKSRGITKGISYDEGTGHNINTPQLGMALKGMGGVDVYGSDACLMQMPEVDYELKDNVQYIVGSEETEPGDGYTYDLFLGPVVANPAMTAEQVGVAAVDGYINHYVPSNQGATQSLIKTAALPGYLTAVNDFVAAATKANEKPLVKTAISSSQSFAVSDNHDVWHFLSLYAASSKNAAVKAKAKALQDYVANTLVVHNRISGSYTNAKGLSVYLPGYGFNSDYNSLAWAKASQWDEFIGWYSK